MTEILTESFCERCGTRYTFESNAPRRSRVGRVRTLSKGLRNFVLSDESSFSEALADARSEEELSATAHQLDAFHKTFNFCLTCRQYTCGTCWNQTEGRCLTCAPLPDADVAAEYPQALPLGTDGHEHGEIEEAWPEADLEHINAVLGLPAAPESLQDATETQAADATLPEPEDTIETEAADATIPDPATAASGAGTWPADIKATAAPDDHPEMAAPDDHPEMAAPDDHSDAEWAAAAAGAAGSSETELIGVAPGQSLEDAIAAYESRLDEQELAEASAAASAAERADAASTAEPGFDTPGLMGPTETATETEAPRPPEAPSEPTADEATTSPEEMAAAEATPGDTPPSPPAAAPTDVIAQPTWPVAPAARPTSDGVPAPVPSSPSTPAPSTPPSPAPDDVPATPSAPWLRVAPDNDAAPTTQWPSTPAWPTASGREMPTTLAGRPLLPREDTSALWAASAREVLGPAPAGGPAPSATASPQPCVQCGLSLSANARFCRRCGSRQG